MNAEESVSDAVSVLITTSPIPLNPETALIDTLVSSLETHVFGGSSSSQSRNAEKNSSKIPLIIFCDGASEVVEDESKTNYKKTRITQTEWANYLAFVERLEQVGVFSRMEGGGFSEFFLHFKIWFSVIYFSVAIFC